MPKARLSRTSSRSKKVVLLVGSNPSRAGLGIPFVGTRSYKTLEKWVVRLPEANFYAANAVDEVTENNRPITVKQMRKNVAKLRSKVYSIRPDLIVALGNSASKALLVAGVDDHLKVAHPSGLNRNLNDERYVDNLLFVIRKLIE